MPRRNNPDDLWDDDEFEPDEDDLDEAADDLDEAEIDEVEEAFGPLPPDIADDPYAFAYNPLYHALRDPPDEDDEETWIDLALERINEYGARRFLRRLLRELRTAMSSLAVTEARLAEQVEATENASDEDVLELVLGHLEGRSVVAVDVRTGSGARWLAFDDDHGLPVITTEAEPATTEALRRLVGKYLVAAVAERQPDQPRILRLMFHDEPEAARPWLEADTERKAQRRLKKLVASPGFASLAVDARSAALILCPHLTEDEEPESVEIHAAVATLEEHLRGERVADKLALPGGTLALLFDDEHLLPVRPAAGQSPPTAADLERVVGRFLIVVLEDGGSPAPFITAYFHDNPQAHQPLIDAHDRAKLARTLAADPECVRLEMAADSVRGLGCPGHGDQS